MDGYALSPASSGLLSCPRLHWQTACIKASPSFRVQAENSKKPEFTKVMGLFKTLLEDASPEKLTQSLVSPAFCLFPQVLQHILWLVRVLAG